MENEWNWPEELEHRVGLLVDGSWSLDQFKEWYRTATLVSGAQWSMDDQKRFVSEYFSESFRPVEINRIGEAKD